MEALLEIREVSKTFPGVQALQKVDFTLQRGEVMALVGANGAGKSTLIKIITGVYQKDEGEMRLNGKTVHFAHPSEANRYGISTIYQELTVIPNLNVAENIFLKHIKQKAGLVDYRLMYESAGKILEELDLKLNVRTKVSSLPIADQQMVEIAKAIGEDAKIFIMDEPTSALTKDENDKLFAIIRSLKNKGAGIIFVSHRLSEVFEVADRVTILRDGKVVGHYAIEELSEKRLVELLVGKKLDQLFPKHEAEIGEVVLKVDNLRRGKRVQGISFELRRGEILGLTGLLGSGRTEVVRCIFGIDKPEGGSIHIKGRLRRIADPVEASNAGLALVPENRKEQGLVLQMHVADNICLGSKEVTLLRSKKREEGVASKFVKAFNIRCTHVRQVIKNLSGGNQQKTVISKWVSRNPEILILDEPTRGIDVSAKAEVHALIGQMVRNGVAVLLISSEFDEIMGLCDRAVVLYEGKVVGEIDRQNFSEEKLLAYAHGHRF
jgi:ABC-type sugar transport system ATPase subunit